MRDMNKMVYESFEHVKERAIKDEEIAPKNYGKLIDSFFSTERDKKDRDKILGNIGSISSDEKRHAEMLKKLDKEFCS